MLTVLITKNTPPHLTSQHVIFIILPLNLSLSKISARPLPAPKFLISSANISTFNQLNVQEFLKGAYLQTVGHFKSKYPHPWSPQTQPWSAEYTLYKWTQICLRGDLYKYPTLPYEWISSCLLAALVSRKQEELLILIEPSTKILEWYDPVVEVFEGAIWRFYLFEQLSDQNIILNYDNQHTLILSLLKVTLETSDKAFSKFPSQSYPQYLSSLRNPQQS